MPGTSIETRDLASRLSQIRSHGGRRCQVLAMMGDGTVSEVYEVKQARGGPCHTNLRDRRFVTRESYRKVDTGRQGALEAVLEVDVKGEALIL